MTIPIALQLYSVRELLANDFEKTVRQVAAIGYQGVEPAGFPGTTPEKAASLFEQLNLEVTSLHAPPPLGDEKSRSIDLMKIFGCPYLIVPYMPDENFETYDGIRKVCDVLNEANHVAKENNFSLGYHNHWWEAEYLVDGKPAYQTMLELLEPDIIFQVDTYWMKVGGLDVPKVFESLRQRTPLVHVKDGPGDKSQPMTAIGRGIMDWDAIIPGIAETTKWLIVEMDRCETDTLQAVNDSFTYLKGKNF